MLEHCVLHSNFFYTKKKILNSVGFEEAYDDCEKTASDLIGWKI